MYVSRKDASSPFTSHAFICIWYQQVDGDDTLSTTHIANTYATWVGMLMEYSRVITEAAVTTASPTKKVHFEPSRGDL